MQSCNYGTKLDTVLDPNKIRGCNQQLPACYLPPIIANTQGNKVKGMMSIPAVGSHVSVYFDAGDVQYPIIDGYFYSQEDIKGIFDIQN
jgi:hypothetical protein